MMFEYLILTASAPAIPDGAVRWVLWLVSGMAAALVVDYDAYTDHVAAWKEGGKKGPRPQFKWKKALVRAGMGLFAGGAGATADASGAFNLPF